MNDKAIKVLMSMMVVVSFMMYAVALIPHVSADSDVYNFLPEGKDLDQFKREVAQANERGFLASGGSAYWGACAQTCGDFRNNGDCNACSSGEVESNVVWIGDPIGNPVNTYPELWCGGAPSSDYYQKEAFCQPAVTQCSGGFDEGDKKCSSGDVYRCEEGGVWEFREECDYGCDDGRCEDKPEPSCDSHETKQCSGNSVYWYDSCGNKEEEYKRCDGDEQCSNAVCISNPTNQCNDDSDCAESEICTGSLSCEVLECSEDEILQDHECIPVGGGNILFIILGSFLGIALIGGGGYYVYKLNKNPKRRKR